MFTFGPYHGDVGTMFGQALLPGHSWLWNFEETESTLYKICLLSTHFWRHIKAIFYHVGTMFVPTLYPDKLELETSQDLVIMVYNKWKWSDPFLWLYHCYFGPCLEYGLIWSKEHVQCVFFWPCQGIVWTMLKLCLALHYFLTSYGSEILRTLSTWSIVYVY